jgi:hypothetical protein
MFANRLDKTLFYVKLNIESQLPAYLLLLFSSMKGDINLNYIQKILFPLTENMLI